MGDSKKISFGFSKMSKKNIVPSNVVPKDDKIEFIECVEKNSIKIVGQDEEKKKTELIIPMKIDSLLKHSMIQAIKENANSVETPIKNSEDAVALSKNSETTEELSVSNSKSLTLDELAAKELLEDAKKDDKKDTKIFTVPLASRIGEGEKESSIEDYENIPVSDFGLAMLRGMGWQPDVGIGKNTKRVRPVSPIVRPKGMGLGANQVCKQNQGNEGKNSVITKGSCIKVLAGQHKNLYGIVEGLDDASGRLIVKLTISSSIISINEFLIQVVSKEEYNKLSTFLSSQIDANNSMKPEKNRYGLLSGESAKKSNNSGVNDTNLVHKSDMKSNKDNSHSNYKYSESSKHSKSYKLKHSSRYSLSPDSKSSIKKPRSSRYSTSSDTSSSDSAKNYKSSKGKLQGSHLKKKSSIRSDKIIISDSSDDSQDSSSHNKSEKKYKKHKSHKRSKNAKHKSRSRSPKYRKNRKTYK